MQPHEKQEMLASLADSREALADALQGVTEEIAGRQTDPARWSIRQCVEHVAIAEDYLFGQIGSAAEADEPMGNLAREARIRERGADRKKPMPAPEQARPAGRFATLAQALQHFLDSRERTMQFVESCTADLRARITRHPIIGTVNCQEVLLMMAAHPRRHAEQIAEIRAALQPPPQAARAD
jgi:uncharacterized damage-inducible protein DinB